MAKATYSDLRIKVFDSVAAVYAFKFCHRAPTGKIITKIGIVQSILYYYFRSNYEALEVVCLHRTGTLPKRL